MKLLLVAARMSSILTYQCHPMPIIPDNGGDAAMLAVCLSVCLRVCLRTG